MSKKIDFFDGVSTETVPTIGSVSASSLLNYLNDAAYEAANGTAARGNIYYNSGTDKVRYYNGTTWVDIEVPQLSATAIADGSISDAEFQYLNGVTSNIQDQLDSASGGVSDHIADATDAHAASAISNTPTGNLSATDVQSALDELQSDVDSRVPSSSIGAASGVASLDGGGKVPAAQLPNTVMELQGFWNASTNTPTLADGSGSPGDIYEVDTAGTTDFGSGNITFAVGDWAVYAADGLWHKSLNSNEVTSVNSLTGAVSLGLNNLSDVNAPSPAARNQIRRNSGNTEWESFNPNDSAVDVTAGSNITMATVATSVVQVTSGSLVSIDEIPAGYANQKFVLTNKTGADITLSEDTGSTPANQIITGTGADLSLADGASVNLVYDSLSSRWRIVGGSGSGGGGLATIKTVYLKDVKTLGSAGGTFNSGAWQTRTINTLEGDVTLATLSANRFTLQPGVYDVDISVPAMSVNQHIAKLVADPSGSPVDVAFSESSYASSADLVNNRTSIKTRLNISVPTEYEVQHRCAATKATDGFGVPVNLSQETYLNGTITRVESEAGSVDGVAVMMSDWIPYTPTFNGYGTVTVSDFKYKREGTDLIIKGTFTSGTPTANEGRIGLPSGITSATALPTLSDAGSYVHNGGSSTLFNFASLIEPSVTYLTVGRQSNSSGTLAKQNANAVIGSGNIISVNARVPVEGWEVYGIASVITSEVAVSLGAGWGSTNTKIRRFTNLESSVGTDITYADSATLGGTFTINTTGVYSITYTEFATGGTAIGISVNSSTNTTNIESMTYAQGKRATEAINGTTTMSSISPTLRLTAGDVVRAHGNGSNLATGNTNTIFIITRVN